MTGWLAGILVMGGAWAAEPQWDLLTAGEGWKEVAKRTTDEGEVKVLHRKIGELNCIQGLATTAVSPAKLLEVALDIPSAPRWSSSTLVASEILKRGEGTVDFWQMLDIPDWTLVTDRFWVLRGEQSVVKGTGFRFRWQRLDAGLYPATTNPIVESGRALEVPVNYGEWEFLPTAGGTDVTYRLCTDSGGAIPAWLQKIAAQKTLPDTVADLMREARRRVSKP